MSTVVKTIKNYLTDDTIYPITKASAVYMEGSTNTVEGLLGNTDISGYGDGTVTGLLDVLNTNAINNEVNDANDAIKPNIYYSAEGTAANIPFAAAWIIWCSTYSSVHKTQYATMTNVSETRTYVRNLANGIWGNWRKIEDTRPVTITNGVVTSVTP